ncbi:MAG: HD domain-containing protein [Clostridia bacterium]|nr:HD domain-containing protein [Clostridia bacterium]
MKETLVTRAVAFAARAHDGQFRKGTSIPYIVHPMEAAAIAAGISEDPDVIAAAVLHDTVEDTGASIEMIKDQFGARVAELVAAESENKREDQKAEDTWKVRKQETIDHLLRTTDRDVKILALADKLSNLRAIYRDYKEIGDDLWERFNQKDPAMIGWYYRSFKETCAELSDTTAYMEYVELLDKVFDCKH